MVIKNALIYVKKEIISFSLQHHLVGLNVYDLSNNVEDKLKIKIQQYLTDMIDQLYQRQLINEKPIILQFISSLQPYTICYAIDCSFSIKNLKQLQNILLNNKFKIKIAVK